VVWTGIGGGSTCSNWQSAGMSGQPADLGVEGRTRFVANNGLPPSNWTNRGSFACNLLEPLLCVCWSGRD
jgi:hypothetical protein